MCDCINTTNVLLKEHNGQLVCTLFGEPSRVVIETMKLEPKKRKPPAMLASYCPFCGEKHGAPPAPIAMSDIAAERRRQIDAEGWSSEHDDEHDDGVMADAAGVYAISAGSGWEPGEYRYDVDGEALAPAKWPWTSNWFKPDGGRRDLVKAGALIVAEIERLDRAAAASGASGDA